MAFHRETKEYYECERFHPFPFPLQLLFFLPQAAYLDPKASGEGLSFVLSLGRLDPALRCVEAEAEVVQDVEQNVHLVRTIDWEG
jgi:hypothetical protein